MPFPSPGDLPDPGIEPSSPALAGEFFTTEPPGKPLCSYTVLLKNPTLFSSDLCLFYSHFESIIQFPANWPGEGFYDKVAGKKIQSSRRLDGRLDAAWPSGPHIDNSGTSVEYCVL